MPTLARERVGTLWSFGDVDVVDVVQLPTPTIPLLGLPPSEDDDRVAVLFLVDGDATVEHDGSHFRFRAGSAAFSVAGSLATVEASEACRVVIVSVLRSRLVQAGVDVTAPFGAFAYSASRSSPLPSFLEALTDILRQNTLPSEPTATVLSELVTRLFLADGTYSVGSSRPELDLRALADSLIALGSGDSDFDVTRLAAELAVSPAELERAFTSTGNPGTASAAIREQRIAMAMLGLQASGNTTLSLPEITKKAGFQSERDLDRALKAVYGTTVKAVLLSQAEPAAVGRKVR